MSLVERLIAMFTPQATAGPPADASWMATPVGTAAVALGEVSHSPGDAMGRALGGHRVTCLTEPTQLPSLRHAVRHHLPVVFVSPEPLSDAVIELRPRDAQEAVDLLCVAHAVASVALLPVALVWRERGADVVLPDAAWLGDPDDAVDAPTPAQRIVFAAEQRRRLPRWFDLDHPTLLGPSDPPAAVRDAANTVWFTDAVPELLSEVLRAFERHSGRSVGRVRRVGNGPRFVVAAGPVHADPVRGTSLLTVSVTRPPLGVAEALAGSQDVLVIDDVLSGSAAGPILADERDLGPLLRRLGRGGEPPRFVGVEVVPAKRAAPKRDALDAQLRRARPDAEGLGMAASEQPEPTAVEDRVPAIVRALGDASRRYDAVARFWTEVGQPLRMGLALTADPFQALDLLPPRTAALRDRSPTREQLPAFDPSKCTGCGACWVACPDSALHAVAVSPGAVVGDSTALRPVASKLGKTLTTALGTDCTTAGQALSAAAEGMLPKLPPERAAPIRAAIDARIAEIGIVQLAWTEVLGDDLLSIAVDTDACSACGACSDACDDGAMLALPQEGRLQTARELRLAFDALPDTAATTLERLAVEGFDALGTLLLTRACSMAMAGGADGSAGAKRSIRALLAVSEARRQPRVHHRLRQLATLQASLDEQIQADLTRLLPSNPSDLAHALANDALAQQVGETLKGVDQRALHHKAVLVHRLTQLQTALHERARFGLVLTPGVATSLAKFPYNPFAAPVAVTDDPDTILGITHAVVAQALTEASLVRASADAAKGRRPGTTVLPQSWEDLDREERAAVPPVVVITDVPPPPALLESRLPIKVLLLVPTPRAGHAEELLALSRRGTFTLQSAIGATAHLVDGIQEALEYDGPALMRVLTDPDETWPCLRFVATDADPLIAEARRLADEAVAAERSAEIDALKRQHADELAGLRAKVEAELAERVQSRLMQLAGYPDSPGQAK